MFCCHGHSNRAPPRKMEDAEDRVQGKGLISITPSRGDGGTGAEHFCLKDYLALCFALI